MELYYRFQYEISWIETEFLDAQSKLITKFREKNYQTLAAEMAVIRLYDAWARFSRNLIIQSAAGKTTSASGRLLIRAKYIKNISDVVPYLISTYKKKKYEPSWAVPSECIDAVNRLNIQNKSTIINAFGSTNSPIEEIRLVRNFFAHRGEFSANSIRQSAWWQRNIDLDAMGLLYRQTYGGVSVFQRWIGKLEIVAMAAIQ